MSTPEGETVFGHLQGSFILGPTHRPPCPWSCPWWWALLSSTSCLSRHVWSLLTKAEFVFTHCCSCPFLFFFTDSGCFLIICCLSPHGDHSDPNFIWPLNRKYWILLISFGLNANLECYLIIHNIRIALLLLLLVLFIILLFFIHYYFYSLLLVRFGVLICGLVK